jgi:hypothetical protein
VAVTVSARQRTQVCPIGPDDIGAVARFLHEHLNPKVSTGAWAGAVEVPWNDDRPNAGFMLIAGDNVVGAHLAFYSQRMIDGRTERFCNLGAWCVLEQYRLSGLKLLTSLLDQDGYHFTDLSPSGNVIDLNKRLGFEFLDTRTTLVPNLPWPSRPGRCQIISDPQAIAARLSGNERQIHVDHAATAAARHLILVRDEEQSYVIFRKDRRQGLPVFATVLYASNPELLIELGRPLGRHLLLRHGAAATLLERAVVPGRPRPSFQVAHNPHVKMFRSPTLEAAQIDYLYSELECVSW